MKYEIEIEGLPEGWKPVAYRYGKPDESCFLEGRILEISKVNKNYEQLIVKKIQPRRIVLEETTELRIPNPGEWYCTSNGSIARCNGIKYSPSVIWREVKEDEGK